MDPYARPAAFANMGKGPGGGGSGGGGGGGAGRGKEGVGGFHDPPSQQGRRETKV